MPPGHSRRVWYGVGGGKRPCDGRGDDKVLGTRLQRARDDADPRGRAGLFGPEPDGAGAHVCELLRWRRPNGRLKARECREFLERLDAEGTVVLPDKRRDRATGSVTRVPRAAAGEPGRPLDGTVREVGPLRVELVREPAERLLFRELVGRYHYLAHTVPFGAHRRYLLFASRLSARWSAACSLRARRGAWRRATAGSAGTMRHGRGICSTWSTTADSCCCRGSRSGTWPARCSRAASWAFPVKSITCSGGKPITCSGANRTPRPDDEHGRLLRCCPGGDSERCDDRCRQMPRRSSFSSTSLLPILQQRPGTVPDWSRQLAATAARAPAGS